MAFRDFLKGTFKIALAIFIAVLALAGVASVFLAYQKEEAKAYEVVKTWREDLKQPLQFDLVARTKLVDGYLRVALEVDGYPAYLSDPRLRARNKDAQIILDFLDRDGFKVYEKALKISEFSGTVDATGKRVGLNHQFEDYLSVSRYKTFAVLNVRWTLDPVIPPDPKPVAVPTVKPKVANTEPKPKVASTEAEDHCAPGLSKTERLRRLATHGVVRQTRANTYTVGDTYSLSKKEITFYSESIGGEMLACR